MTEHIGAAPYERGEGRTGHRNGHKPRTLRTRDASTSSTTSPCRLKKRSSAINEK